MARAVTLIDGVLLPVDRTRAGMPAFYHALRLALNAQVHLRMVTVDPPNSDKVYGGFPHVRDTITRWENLDHHADSGDLQRLGLGVRKQPARGHDPVEVLAAQARPDQLMVLAPRRRSGLSALLQKSVSEGLLQRSAGPCLLIPEGVPGFVDDQGVVSISRVLCPVAVKPAPEPALDLTGRLCDILKCRDVAVDLLHVGLSDPPWPEPDPYDAVSSWNRQRETGDPAAVIVEVAARSACDLIVMVSEGRTGWLEALRGSVTERVVKTAPCPVLVLHA